MTNPEKQLEKAIEALNKAMASLHEASQALAYLPALSDELAEILAQEVTDSVLKIGLSVEITKLEAALEIIQEK